jgi:PAS domain S-box-containing protein
LQLIDGIIWECDSDTQQFTFFNDSAERFLGFSSGPLSQSPDFWRQRIHPQDLKAVIQQRSRSCFSHEAYVMEYRMLHVDGRTLWFRDTAKMCRNEEGRARLCGLTINITELKEMQLQLQELNAGLENRIIERTAELNDSIHSLEGICYSIAHDLRAPARAMDGFATALLEDCGENLSPEGGEYARRIILASRRMNELIEDLLAYGQLLHREVPCRAVDLNAIARQVLQDLALEMELTGANVRVAPNLPIVLAHEIVLRQALLNLVSNAIKFVAEGVKPEVRIWAETREAAVRVWIDDNGIGIDAQHQERIFRVFERLHCADKYSGTGIGLALVKKGVERMKGCVGVEPGLTQGSRFWIELPQAAPVSFSREKLAIP